LSISGFGSSWQPLVICGQVSALLWCRGRKSGEQMVQQ
jgi:hypothetical protein